MFFFLVPSSRRTYYRIGKVLARPVVGHSMLQETLDFMPKYCTLYTDLLIYEVRRGKLDYFVGLKTLIALVNLRRTNIFTVKTALQAS